ncbi:MAG: ACT domain-containing protein [Chloroflexota bacterium]|nr:ACT domain-containing protein [Chloroflexota bacterium]
MKLSILPDELVVCRLAPDQEVPAWVWAWEERALLSITYTADELSIVCPATVVPPGVQCQPGWRAIKVRGPLDFALTGILASLAVPLADSGIAIFALSTFDTDYLLVSVDALSHAREVLERAGHIFEHP